MISATYPHGIPGLNLSTDILSPRPLQFKIYIFSPHSPVRTRGMDSFHFLTDADLLVISSIFIFIYSQFVLHWQLPCSASLPV